MCNLYAMTSSQAAIREFTRAARDSAGNLPVLPGIYPDSLAPVVFTNAAGERELALMRWGMPGPPAAGARGVTNIRNTASPHWRRWMGVENRCLVPATAFCEWADTKPRKTPVWFALAEGAGLFCFAGIWTAWSGTRGTKAAPVTGEHRVFGFLTTSPNAEVAAVHPKAMPVILRTAGEMEAWMTGEWGKLAGMQRGVGDGVLRIVGGENNLIL